MTQTHQTLQGINKIFPQLVKKSEIEIVLSVIMKSG